MKLKLTLFVFFTWTILFSNSTNPRKRITEKVFSYNKKTGDITFSDTKDELLKEVYFYDEKNQLVASIRNISYNTNFEISCWDDIHHISIVTDKKIHVEFIK